MQLEPYIIRIQKYGWSDVYLPKYEIYKWFTSILLCSYEQPPAPPPSLLPLTKLAWPESSTVLRAGDFLPQNSSYIAGTMWQIIVQSSLISAGLTFKKGHYQQLHIPPHTPPALHHYHHHHAISPSCTEYVLTISKHSHPTPLLPPSFCLP